MRTFEYSDAKSYKFWNIELQGKTFTVTFGRQGTGGQTQTKEFADEAKARKEHDKLIKEKLAKGYRETTGAAAVRDPTRDALEAALAANPYDVAAHAAYADYLTEQGDPQGELIHVQMALEDEGLSAAQRKKLRQQEGKLLKAHEKEWVGDWAALAENTGPEGGGQLDFRTAKYEFRRGILSVVTIDELTTPCALAFVEAPQTRLVRELYVGGYAWAEDEDVPGDALVYEFEDPQSQQVLGRWPYFSNLRVFQLGWTSDEDYEDFCHFQCHLSGKQVHDLVGRMPNLEELYLFAQGVDADSLFAYRMPNLRVLQLYHSHQYPLAKLAENPSLTNLTHLLCHPHALQYGAEPAIRLPDLRAVLRSPHLKNLTHLRLRLTDFGDAGCEEIVRSGALKRLKVLDLRHGCVSDEGARILADCPDLRNLESLDLSRNELTGEGVEALEAVGVPVQTEHQHASTAGQGPDEMQFLYEGDYE